MCKIVLKNLKKNKYFELKIFCFYFCHVKDDDDQKMAIMRKAFQMFDTTKSGFIETIKISTILNTMGQLFDEAELQALIEENDPEGSNKVNFDGFCNIASHFLEEEDDEAMQQSVLIDDRHKPQLTHRILISFFQRIERSFPSLRS